MFSIDLNDPRAFTLAGVSQMIGSEVDTDHWQLRVTVGGIAFLSSDVGSVNIGGLSFRLETWSAGSDYVGARAAADQKWISTVFNVLNDNWPKPKSTYIDSY
jgi:hypothetical protein